MSLVRQAAILLGGNGFCQGLFHNITSFLVEISNFRLISHLDHSLRLIAIGEKKSVAWRYLLIPPRKKEVIVPE